ncbi:hypothetical protein EsH8_III_000296 [Colletotrichum jinshuiense]
MSRSKTLHAAEKKALEGRNDSQDSQAIFERYVTEYGIGVTSSSPPRPTSTASRHNSRGRKRRRDSPPTRHSDPPSHEESQHNSFSVPSTAPPAISTGNALPQQDFHHETPSPALPVAAAAAGDPDRGPNPKTPFAFLPSTELSTANNLPGSLLTPRINGDAIDPVPEAIPALCAADKNSARVNVPPRASNRPPSTKAKMDVSQQSPTQDNDERDYENYYEPPSFVPTSPISQDHAAENHTLREEESVVVDFGNLNHLIQTDTQVEEEPSSIPDDAAPANTRGTWRNRTSSSQQQSSVQRPDGQSPILPAPLPPPQTPAHRQNPFAGMNKLGEAALVGSQLFGQTQFSSAVKIFSPTSSRPSPHVYANNSISPNIAETSPLKNRYNVTSPPDLLSSSPQAIRIDQPVPQDRDRSPSNSGPPEDGTVPDSPQLVPTNARALPEPIETYEKMVDSQKRKGNGTEAEGNVSGEESDDMADTMRRRKRAALKQEAAAKQLTNISVRRPSSRDALETPSMPNMPRNFQARATRYRARRIEEDSTASEDEVDEFRVADSQGQGAVQESTTRASPDLADPGARAKPGLVSSNDAVPDSTGATQKSAPNGGIPGTESSGDSSRPKDLIPETSPNNTQSMPAGRERASSNELLAVPRPKVTEDLSTPANQPKECEVNVDITPNTPQPAPLQPSRRSSRKSRPTLKAQSLRSAARVVVSSEPVSMDEVGPANEDDAPQLSAANDTRFEEEGAASPHETHVRPGNPIAAEEEAPLPSSPPLLLPLAKSTATSGLALETQGPPPNPSTPDARELIAAQDPPDSASTLSVLTTTPVPSSSKTSPATQESVELPPLSPDKSKRGRQPTKSLPRLSTGSRVSKPGTRRQSRRATRLDSASTDELTRSPSVNGFENSIIQPPKTTARGSRLSMLSHTSKDNIGKPDIFAGMAFAISFQSKKDGEKPDQYEHRLGQSRDVEKMIIQSGGYLLNNGFEELFESNSLKSTATSPTSETKDENPLTFTPFAQTMGFTALIADGHSRKVKYMQALALGLPCISDRWVATCVAKGTIVDWIPYLLCAGQSTFLRDAIRSRYLAPYPATEARLVDVVEKRPKLLDGSKILLVMKKSRAEEKKMPYVFLAHVLGATLSRAYSLDEAKETLRHRELLGDPYNWVYVDENTGTEDGLFNINPPASKSTKKRKRTTASAADEAAHPPKKIRTLSNELVIQSLILGRMIEEGELEA